MYGHKTDFHNIDFRGSHELEHTIAWLNNWIWHSSISRIYLRNETEIERNNKKGRETCCSVGGYWVKVWEFDRRSRRPEAVAATSRVHLRRLVLELWKSRRCYVWVVDGTVVERNCLCIGFTGLVLIFLLFRNLVQNYTCLSLFLLQFSCLFSFAFHSTQITFRNYKTQISSYFLGDCLLTK